jgi:hypothetical protein
MSRRHQLGLMALTDGKDERDAIISRPFGGTHILFTGDLWKLAAIHNASRFSRCFQNQNAAPPKNGNTRLHNAPRFFSAFSKAKRTNKNTPAYNVVGSQQRNEKGDIPHIDDDIR